MYVFYDMLESNVEEIQPTTVFFQIDDPISLPPWLNGLIVTDREEEPHQIPSPFPQLDDGDQG